MKKFFVKPPLRLKKQSAYDKEAYEKFSDLSLVGKTCEDNIRKYDIINDKEERVFQAKCQLNHGSLEVIELYSSTDFNETTLKIQKSFSRYDVLKEEVVIGKIEFEEDCLNFLNMNSEVLYTATLVSADRKYQSLSLEKLSQYFYQTELHFEFREKNVMNLGSYFFALHNIDLTQDKELLFDRYIAVALAIIIDEVIMLSIKPLVPSMGSIGPFGMGT